MANLKQRATQVAKRIPLSWSEWLGWALVWVAVGMALSWTFSPKLVLCLP